MKIFENFKIVDIKRIECSSTNPKFILFQLKDRKNVFYSLKSNVEVNESTENAVPPIINKSNQKENEKIEVSKDTFDPKKENELSQLRKNKETQYKIMINKLKGSEISYENTNFLIKRKEFYIIHEINTDITQLLEYLTYSNTHHSPFSFSNSQHTFGFTSHHSHNEKSLQLKFPSPKYLTFDDYFQQPDGKIIFQNFLKGTSISQVKGVISTDSHLLKRFSGLLLDMIVQLCKRLIGGPPVSLSVRIFEPKSSLNRYIEMWGYAPKYLSEASKAGLSKIERMKLIATFGISGLILLCKQLKPFNPLIGETYEGSFSDGTRIYAEHIGHYPTLTRYLLVNNDYRLYCCLDLDAKLESFGNVIKIIQKGKIVIEFPKLNERIIYTLPILKLDNCKSEKERNAFLIDYLTVYDIKNKLKASVEFGYDKKDVTHFTGLVYEYQIQEKDISGKDDVKDSENRVKSHKAYLLNLMKGTASREGSSFLCDIRGCFTKTVFIDKVKYWDFRHDEADYPVPDKYVLPSDTRYREDLIWLYYALYLSRNMKEFDTFISYSQGWKLETEYLQRKEREIKANIRKKYIKK